MRLNRRQFLLGATALTTAAAIPAGFRQNLTEFDEIRGIRDFLRLNRIRPYGGSYFMERNANGFSMVLQQTLYDDMTEDWRSAADFLEGCKWTPEQRQVLSGNIGVMEGVKITETTNA